MVNYFYTTDGNYTPRDRINTICNKNIESFIDSSSTTTIEDTKKVINEISTNAQLLAAQEIHTNIIKALEAQKRIMQALQASQLADIRLTKAEADQVYSTLGKLHAEATFAVLKLQIIQLSKSEESKQSKQSKQTKQIEEIAQASETAYVRTDLMNNTRENELQEYQILLATQITQNQTIQTTLEQITLVIQTQLLELTETHTRVQSQIQTQLKEQTKAYSEILTQTQKYIPKLESLLTKAQTLFVEAQTAHKLAIHALQKQILATEATQAAQKVNLLIITLLQKPTSFKTFLADLSKSITMREIIKTLQNKCFLAQKEATQIALFQSNESTQLKHSKQASLAFQASQVTLSKSTFINDTSINVLNRKPTQNLTEEKVEEMRILQILEKAYLEQVQEAQTTQIALAQVVQETQKQATLTHESLTYITNSVQKQILKQVQEAQKQEAQKQEAQKQEAQKQATQKQATQKQETQKQEAQKQETQKQETQKQEAQKQATQKQETQKQEAQKQETQKQETQKQETQKQETQKQETQKQETQKQEAQKQATLTRESPTYVTNAVQKQINDKSKLYLLYIGGGCVGFILFCILIYIVFYIN